MQTIVDNIITKKINRNLFEHISGNQQDLEELGVDITKYYKSIDENGNLIEDCDHWLFTTPVNQIS